MLAYKISLIDFASGRSFNFNCRDLFLRLEGCLFDSLIDPLSQVSRSRCQLHALLRRLIQKMFTTYSGTENNSAHQIMG